MQYSLVALVLAALCHAATAADKPHILMILVDDFGWANSGLHPKGDRSSTEAEVVTPVLRNLVSQGILFRRHYTYNYCSPSRASLQSGRYPNHVSFMNDEPLAYNPKDTVSGMAGIPRNMTGVAELMKKGGYVTAMTGKWDAGMAAYENTPQGKGYDTYFGYYHHANDYWSEKCTLKANARLDLCYKHGMELVDLWWTKEAGTLGEPAFGLNGTLYEDELFIQHSIKLVEEHDASKPLFLFHSFHVVHTPLQVPAHYAERMQWLAEPGVGDWHRQYYAAMVMWLDEAMGRLVAAYEKKGMWENTLLVLSSDNGGPSYSRKMVGMYGSANNIPLRGGKVSDFEGGTRTNAFASGGFIPRNRRGTKLDKFIHISDWYATFAELAGVDPTDKKAEEAGLPAHDSVSQVDVLVNDGPSKRKELWISRYALIQPPWKLLTGGQNDALNSLPNPPHFPGVDDLNEVVLMNKLIVGWNMTDSDAGFASVLKCDQGCLFNIMEDEGEFFDVADKHPDIVAKMKARLAELDKTTFWPERGESKLSACEAGVKIGGYYTPFVTDPPIHKSNYLERMKQGLPHRDPVVKPYSEA